MEKIKIFKEIDEVQVPSNIKSLPPLEQLAFYWGVIALVLKFVKIFTGAKGDIVIDNILLWGEENFPE